MALPTKGEIGGLEYSHLGLPFADVPAKDLAETGGLEFSLLGLPFVTNFSGSTYGMSFTQAFPTVTINMPETVGIPVLELSQTTYDPTVSILTLVPSDLLSFTQTTQAPNINESVIATQVTFTQTTRDPNIKADVRIPAFPIVDQMDLHVPNVIENVRVLVDTKAFAQTTQDVIVNAAEVVSSPVLSFTQTQIDPAVNSGMDVEIDQPIAFTMTGLLAGIPDILKALVAALTMTVYPAVVNAAEVIAVDSPAATVQTLSEADVNSRSIVQIDTGNFLMSLLDPNVRENFLVDSVGFTQTNQQASINAATAVGVDTPVGLTQTLNPAIINERLNVSIDTRSFTMSFVDPAIVDPYIPDSVSFTQTLLEPAVTGADNVQITTLEQTQVLYDAVINERYVVDCTSISYSQTANDVVVNAVFNLPVDTKTFAQSFGSVIVPTPQDIPVDDFVAFAQGTFDCVINEGTILRITNVPLHVQTLIAPSLITMSGTYTTDWKQPNAGRTVGTPAWQNPGNVLAFDNTYVTNTTIGTLSSTAVAYDYRLNLPTAARVTSYEASYEAKRTFTGTSLTLTMGLHTTKDGGTTPSVNKSTAVWSTTEVAISASDFGDTNYTVAEFNSTDFGMVIKQSAYSGSGVVAVTRSLDSIKVRVTYRVPQEIVLVDTPITLSQTLISPLVTTHFVVQSLVSYGQTMHDVDVIADDNVAVDLTEYTQRLDDVEVGYIQWIYAPFSQLRLTAQQPMIETIYMVDNSGQLLLTGETADVFSATTLKPDISTLYLVTPRAMINFEREA